MPVIVFGSLNMDLTARTPRLPNAGETVLGVDLLKAAGGKGANQAVAAARLGAKTRLFGRVGDDDFGRGLLEELRRNDVDTGGVRFDAAAPTGTALIAVDARGNNQIVVVPGANARVGADDARTLSVWLDPSSVVLLQLEVPVSANLAAAQAAREAGAQVVLDPAPVPDDIPWDLIELADVITPNASEASRLVGFEVSGPESGLEAARQLRQRTGRSIVVTLGALGIAIADPKGFFTMQAFRVDPVDTVAAGDAFNGALAAALNKATGLRDACRLGLAAGALAATRQGAMRSLPRADELRAFIAEQDAR